MRIRSSWCTFAALCLLAMVTTRQSAQAEAYPTRPIKVIVPYAAGAAADVIGRIVAQKLSEITGTQFFVENLPGAGGTIGAGIAARAAADGNTVLVVNQDFVIQPWVKAKVPYDAFKSFVPVGTIVAAPETISVHPSVPATNMKELIALLQAYPGRYNYATPGHGTSPHVATERLFKLTYGLDAVHVPFQGGGPAVTSTLAGHTHILHITLPLVAGHIKEGKLRGLAVAAKTRSQLLPGLPTLQESGVERHEVGYWTGILAPTGTPHEVVTQLNGLLAQALSLPEIRERLATIGFDPTAGTPEDLDALLKAESAEWHRVVHGAGLAVN